MKRFATRALALGTLAVTFSTVGRADSLLTSWNLVTTGNLYAAHDAQGAVRVGGNLYVQNTFEAAANQGAASGPSLVVGGNVTTGNSNGQTVKVNHGDAEIGGAVDGGTTNKNQNGQQIVSAQNGAVTFNPALAGIGAADHAELLADSTAFKNMAPTTGATFTFPSSSGQDGPATFNLTSGTGNVVLDIDASDLFGNSKVQQIGLNLNGHTFADGQSLIINVSSGESLTFAKSFNFVDDFTSQTVLPYIIWNFHDATTINLNNSNFSGALLAPNATLLNNNTIQGSVFVQNFGENSSNGMKAEVHTPLYQGYVPNAPTVPEPAGLAMAGIATLAGAAFGVRRLVA